MPGGHIQPVQQLCVAEFLRRYVGQIDDLVQPLSVAGLMLEYRQGIVYPVQQYPGFPCPFQLVLQFAVAHGKLQIHLLQKLVHIREGLVQLLSDGHRETLHGPDQCTITLQKEQGVVIAVPVFPLPGGADLFVANIRISQNSTLGQKVDKSLRFLGNLGLLLLVCHFFRVLHSQNTPLAILRGQWAQYAHCSRGSL